MKNLLKIFLEGIYGNFKKILFASDRVTDMELRNKIVSGEVKPTDKVSRTCIGCGGCANVCPTNAITMKPLQNPVELDDGWIIKEVPELSSDKCVVCYWCHDFCPVYALYEEPGSIHPNDVGDYEASKDRIVNKPYKIPEDKILLVTQYMNDKNMADFLKNKNNSDEEI